MHAAKLKPRANYHKAKLNQTEIPAVTEQRYGSTSDLSFDDMRIRYSSSQMPLQLRAAAVHTQRRRSYIVPGQESHLEVGTSQLERRVPVQSRVEQISGYGGVVQRMPEPEVGEQQIGEGGTVILDPDTIRYCQSSVNDLDTIISSMRENGWAGPPIDVVKMLDGKYTTIDNTRLAAARRVGIGVQANVHSYNAPLSEEYSKRFTTKSGVPTTWGEAIELRIRKQTAAFRKKAGSLGVLGWTYQET